METKTVPYFDHTGTAVHQVTTQCGFDGADGRTNRSVEFKHQNISAVLDELGLPWIPGYKPTRNYQNAIFDAIDSYLTEHPGVLEVPALSVSETMSEKVFVAPPQLTSPTEAIPERLQRLVQKFDRNRKGGGGGRSVRFVHVGRASREENIELPGAALRSSAIQLMGSGVKSVSFSKLLSSIRNVFEVAASAKLEMRPEPCPFRHRRGLGRTRKAARCGYRSVRSIPSIRQRSSQRLFIAAKTTTWGGSIAYTTLGRANDAE